MRPTARSSHDARSGGYRYRLQGRCRVQREYAHALPTDQCDGLRRCSPTPAFSARSRSGRARWHGFMTELYETASPQSSSRGHRRPSASGCRCRTQAVTKPRQLSCPREHERGSRPARRGAPARRQTRGRHPACPASAQAWAWAGPCCPRRIVIRSSFYNGSGSVHSNVGGSPAGSSVRVKLLQSAMSLARYTWRCRSKDLSLDEHVERLLARLGRGVSTRMRSLRPRRSCASALSKPLSCGAVDGWCSRYGSSGRLRAGAESDRRARGRWGLAATGTGQPRIVSSVIWSPPMSSSSSSGRPVVSSTSSCASFARATGSGYPCFSRRTSEGSRAATLARPQRQRGAGPRGAGTPRHDSRSRRGGRNLLLR
jgi:hypothetical protein